jgi:hypothetical protein
MNDRLTNGRLFGKATRESRGKSTPLISGPKAKRSISSPVFVAGIALDLIAAIVLLSVDFTIGMVIFATAGTVLALWASLRVRAKNERRGVGL